MPKNRVEEFPRQKLDEDSKKRLLERGSLAVGRDGQSQQPLTESRLKSRCLAQGEIEHHRHRQEENHKALIQPRIVREGTDVERPECPSH